MKSPAKPAGAKKSWLWYAVIGVALVIAIVATAVIASAVVKAQNAVSPAQSAQAVREDSYRLSRAPDGKVTVVEFLDFECEACGAAYPFIEQMRKQYAGRVTFVARYFPIPSHRNAMNAALAAEAAARQGKFETMYNKLFESQRDWAERQDSQAPRFRQYAADIGLDLGAYDRDVADPSAKARITKDMDEGIALGVKGTPTFFLNGEKLELTSAQDFVNAVEAALAK